MSGPSRRSAAALVYDANAADGAPRVVAKGYGLVAETIVQRAKEAGVYVHEAPEMVSLLMQVDLDARIPPQLYQAVAELLAWLHRLETGEIDDDEVPAVAPAPGAGTAAAPASAPAPAPAPAPGPPAVVPGGATAGATEATEAAVTAVTTGPAEAAPSAPLKTSASPGSAD